MNQIARTVLFVMDDRDWLRKVVIGAGFTLLSCFVIGMPFLFGYLLEVQRRSVRGEESSLPEWDPLPEKFADGVKLLGVIAAYAFGLWIVRAILIHLSWFGILLMGILVVALSMALLYVMVRLALTGDMIEAFKVRDIYQALRDNFVDYLQIWFLGIVYVAVALLGVFACGVGLFFTLFWAFLAVSYTSAKTYRKSQPSESVVTL